MSRSYKKTPVYKTKSRRIKMRKFWKRHEEKKVRMLQTALRKSNKYRRIGDQWNICDYRFYETKPADAAGDDLEWWKKYYFRK